MIVLLFQFCAAAVFGQNVVIVVIDGARYSETFEAKDKYMPRLWNVLRPQGVIYTNFTNAGVAKTLPGHASILSGTWQNIENNGSERPTKPTIFEYYRKQLAEPESSCFVVFGKRKLNVLTHSTDAEYGAQYRAAGAPAGKSTDIEVWKTARGVVQRYHPRLLLVSFPDVDLNGHAGNWAGYTNALRLVDSLVWEFWTTLQSEIAYRDAVTMFVMNDHGRHDDAHGGFREHGDGCDGCRHIMLLALGKGFPPNVVSGGQAYQIDVANTVGDLLHLDLKYSLGRNLIPPSTLKNIR